MTILGAWVVLVLRAQAAYPRPSEHAFAAADPLPDHIPRIIEAIKTRALRTKLAQLGIAIASSGVAYLLLLPGPAALAYVSGPLLLLFITGTGIALGTSAGLAGNSST